MRLSSQMWIQAEIRLCDSRTIPAVVGRKGDPGAGDILVRVDRFDAGIVVFGRGYLPDGRSGWVALTGDDPVDAAAATEVVERRVGRDPDLWVLDIEDRTGTYSPGSDGL